MSLIVCSYCVGHQFLLAPVINSGYSYVFVMALVGNMIYVIKMTITVNVKNLSFQRKVGRMIPYSTESVAPYINDMCNSLNLYNFEYKNCLFCCKEGFICHGHDRLKKNNICYKNINDNYFPNNL